jgi:sucrose-6F-phosphate phosphohydrolase
VHQLSIKLFASDLDGTLIPLPGSNATPADINEFSRVIDESKPITLAYVTGRHFELALEGIAKHALPLPSFLVCDVGTSIYQYANNSWKLDETYTNYLISLWGISHSKDLLLYLKNIEGLSLQEHERQTQLKLSFYTPTSSSEKNCTEIKNRLTKKDVSAEIIYSEDEIKKIGLIDILPPKTAKHTALNFLSEKLNLKNENILYSGDSGNDLAVIEAGFFSILVGNTPQTIKEKALKIANSKDHLYVAEKISAAGVVEGIRFFKERYNF